MHHYTAEEIGAMPLQVIAMIMTPPKIKKLTWKDAEDHIRRRKEQLRIEQLSMWDRQSIWGENGRQ